MTMAAKTKCHNEMDKIDDPKRIPKWDRVKTGLRKLKGVRGQNVRRNSQT